MFGQAGFFTTQGKTWMRGRTKSSFSAMLNLRYSFYIKLKMLSNSYIDIPRDQAGEDWTGNSNLHTVAYRLYMVFKCHGME